MNGLMDHFKRLQLTSLMAGFGHRPSGVGSDRSVNCATNIALAIKLTNVSILPWN